MTVLTTEFFHQDALTLAPLLVGKVLCRRLADGTVLRFRITEAEAYRGEEDDACHARHGKTHRNAPLYAAGGLTYIYLCYGVHKLFNIVSGPQGHPQSVFIRAMEKPFDGPAKWTKAAELSMDDNALPLPSPALWLEDDGCRPDLQALPRVGIAYAQEPWRSIAWRWKMKVSGGNMP